MPINLKPVLIEFFPQDLQRMLSIALDGDRDEALAFVQRDLVKRVEKELQQH